MQLNRRLLNWGAFLVLVGAVPLAVRGGLLTTDQVSSWWSLWPLLIVGIGIGLVLSRTALDFLGGLVVAATFGLIVGAVVTVGFRGFPGSVCGSEVGTTPLEARSGTFSGPAAVDLQLNCGRVDVTGLPGSDWSFSGTGDGDNPPTVTADADTLRVRARENGARFAFVGRQERWAVGIPTGVPLSLDVQLNAGQARVAPGTAELAAVNVQVNAGAVHLDLGTASALESVDVQGNAGSATLILPDASVSGRLQVNAGSIRFCVPAGTALRVQTGDNPIASYEFDGHGLVRTGNTWQSPDFDSASVRIDLRAEANAGSITLNPEDGCDE